MAFPFDVKTHTRQMPGLPGESADAARMTQIESDLDTMLARPTITELNSIPDVDTAGVTDGHTLIYDSSANGGLGGYVAGTATGAVAYIKKGASVILTDADRLNFDTGLNVQQDGGIATQANVFVAFGGTGAANTVARSDHAHTTPSFVSVPYASSGSLSSGSRILAQTNITIPSGITALVTLRVHATVRANGSESNYYKLFLNVDSGASTVESQVYQCVGFVPAPQTFEFGAVVTGNGTQRLMSASIIYSSGVPALVDAGQFVIDLAPSK